MGQPTPPTECPLTVSPREQYTTTEAQCHLLCNWSWITWPYYILPCKVGYYCRYKAVLMQCSKGDPGPYPWVCQYQYAFWFSECEHTGAPPPTFRAELNFLAKNYNLSPEEGMLGDEYRLDDDTAVYRLANKARGVRVHVKFKRHPPLPEWND